MIADVCTIGNQLTGTHALIEFHLGQTHEPLGFPQSSVAIPLCRSRPIQASQIRFRQPNPAGGEGRLLLGREETTPAPGAHHRPADAYLLHHRLMDDNYYDNETWRGSVDDGR